MSLFVFFVLAALAVGSAAGLLETTRHLGHSLGVSLSSGVLGSLVAGVAGGAATDQAGAYRHGFELASLAMAVLSCLAVTAIVWSERRPARPAAA